MRDTVPDGDQPPATVPDPAHPCTRSVEAADFEHFPGDGYQYEIWHGELVRMAPAGRGTVSARPISSPHCASRPVVWGRVYVGDTGFLLHEDPDELDLA